MSKQLDLTVFTRILLCLICILLSSLLCSSVFSSNLWMSTEGLIVCSWTIIVFETPTRALYSTNSKRGCCNWVQTKWSFSHQHPLQVRKMEILNHQKWKVITFHWHVCAKNVHIHDNAFKMSSYQILHNVHCTMVLECYSYSNKCVKGFINSSKHTQTKQSKIPTRISDSLQKNTHNQLPN